MSDPFKFQAEYRETKADKEIGAISNSQYTVRGDSVYMAVGKTVSHLPSGIYQVQVGFMGPVFNKIEIKSDELIDIPGSAAEQIFSDMSSFYEKREEYKKAGFVHKRGYLLEGKPGGGKTSIVLLLAKKVVATGGLVFITGSYVSALQSALDVMKTTEKDRMLMFIMEDIEELAYNNESLLLSILDGEHTLAENVLFVATTNKIENLEPRIRARPGRFDVVKTMNEIVPEVRFNYAQTVLKRIVPADQLEKAAMEITEHSAGLALAHLKEVIVSAYILKQETVPRHALVS